MLSIMRVAIFTFFDFSFTFSEPININLVTPTHFVPLIIEGLKMAKRNGLCIPIVYNSSGYESVDTIKMLDGVVDVYLPDFKYYSDEYAVKYSKCKELIIYTERYIFV